MELSVCNSVWVPALLPSGRIRRDYPGLWGEALRHFTMSFRTLVAYIAGDEHYPAVGSAKSLSLGVFAERDVTGLFHANLEVQGRIRGS